MSRPLDCIVETNGQTVYYLGGRPVSEQEYRRIYPLPTSLGRVLKRPRIAKWPIRSVALAVHPDDVETANRRNRQRGCAAYYEPDGTAVIHSENEKRHLMRIESEVLGKPIVDKDAYY